MNLRFKKRLLSIFSNKKAQGIEAQGSEAMKTIIYITIGLILGFLLWSIVLGLPKFTP